MPRSSLGLLLFVLLSAPASAADIVCAVIDPDRCDHAALLEARLLAEPGIQLVDRAQVAKVLAEQQLQAAFGAAAPGQRVQLGKILKADILLQIRSRKQETDTVVELTISETVGGLRLLLRGVPQSMDAGADVDALVAAVREGVKKSGEKIDAVVAVPPFVSQDLTFENEYLKSSLAKLAEGSVLGRPGVVVVELAEAEALARELALTAPGNALRRPLPIYLLGEFRHNGLGENRTVTLKLRAEQSGKPVGPPLTRSVKPGEVPGIVRDWARKSLEGIGGVVRPAAAPKAEADMLVDRAADFRRLGNWDEAHALLEAALLLEPERRDLHIAALAVIQKSRDRDWSFGERDGEHTSKAARTHLRGIWHLEMYASRGGDLTPYDYPKGTGLMHFFLQLPQMSAVAPQEFRNIIDDCERQQREMILRILPVAAKQGVETPLITVATSRLPARERWRTLETIIRQLQHLPNATDRIMKYCNPDPFVNLKPLDSPEFRRFLDLLATDRDAALREAGVRLKKRLELDLKSEQLVRNAPEDLSAVASRNVTLRPVAIRFEPTESKDGPEGRLFDIVAAGPDIDVLSAGRSLYVMKQKGVTRRVWAGVPFSGPLSLSFDGQYVWTVSSDAKGQPLLLVLDPRSEKVIPFGAASGLPIPPADRSPRTPPYPRLLVNGLSPGRACVVGSFAHRAWIGLATLTPDGEPKVKVFHEAREVADRGAKTASRSLEYAYEPAFIVKVVERTGGVNATRILIGRYGVGGGGPALKVDPERETVHSFGEGMSTSGTPRIFDAICPDDSGKFHYVTRNTVGGKPVNQIHEVSVAENRGRLTNAVLSRGDNGAICSFFTRGRQNFVVVRRMVPKTGDTSAGRKSPVAFSEWWQFDPKTQTTRLLAADLPPVQHLAMSSHFGLVAIGGTQRNGANASLFTATLQDPGADAIANPIFNAPRTAGDSRDAKLRWTATVKPGSYVGTVHALPGAKLVVVHNAKGFPQVFDAETGLPKSDAFPDRPQHAESFVPLSRERFATFSIGDSEARIWGPNPGATSARIPMPKIPAGPEGANYPLVSFSPDGKFAVAARFGSARSVKTCPFRLIEVATGREVLAFDWTGGSTHFTADSRRMLVAEFNGRFRWFKLPGGEPDGGWEFSEPGSGTENHVTGISADGQIIGYYGPRETRTDTAACLLEGQNGKLLRAFGDAYSRSTLTAVTSDGTRVALMTTPRDQEAMIEVFAREQALPVARVRIALTARSIPGFVLTADGRSVYVFDYRASKLSRYDLP